MAYLISNIPYFKCWVRREFTHMHQKYHGEYLHAMAIAVNSMPDRSLSFQLVFTGCESDADGSENVHGGAMWARMPITALVGDIALEEWPERMPTHLAQPWDCPSHHHTVIKFARTSPSPWLCKIAGEFYTGRYLFTVGLCGERSGGLPVSAQTKPCADVNGCREVDWEHCGFAEQPCSSNEPCILGDRKRRP
jgi:hypothetical protein